jgi:peptide/nickel transport system permease protein
MIGRLFSIALTLLLLSILVFALQQLLPGDPAVVLAGEDKSPETIAAIRALYGLDQPLPMQFLKWLGNLLHGDFGISMRLNRSVASLLAEKLPVTLQLAVMALLVGIIVGVPAGVIAAVNVDRPADGIANLLSIIGMSVPNFWLGILFIMVFSVQLGWLPASGYVSPLQDPVASLRAMIMPAVVLGTQVAAVLMRHTRSAMIEVLNADYIRTARAKGIGPARIILRHALRNALVPVVTLGALEFGQLLGGSVLTEFVFTVPGIGKLIVDSVFNRDYAVVQAVVLCSGVLYIALNLLADLAQRWLDPRVRREEPA